MPKISRSAIFISMLVMIALIAAACDSPAEKPTAEPATPTPIPTVVIESSDATSGPDGNADSDDSVASTAVFGDPEVQVCLAHELGFDLDPESGTFDRSLIRSVDPEDVTAAFETCGIEQGGGRAGQTDGGFVGTGIGDPAVRECLTEQLGDDFTDAFGGRDGGGLIGGGLPEEFTAALEECGVDLGAGGFGGGRIFGGGGPGGGGRGGFGAGGFGGDGSFLDCLTDVAGPDAFELLRNSTGDAPPAELLEALEECGGGIPIRVEPDGGIGDGAGPILIEEPTATPIPVSDLTIEQLTCLSGELEPADLANAVIATSSGDLSEIADEVLAALQACGVGA